MDQPLEKRSLDDLPGNDDDEFWGDADKHVNELSDVNVGPHYFDLARGNEAYCSHCGWGFILDFGDRIREGHVYTYDHHLVI